MKAVFRALPNPRAEVVDENEQKSLKEAHRCKQTKTLTLLSQYGQKRGSRTKYCIALQDGAPPRLKFDVILVPPVESEFINLTNFRYMIHKPQLT